MMMGSDTSNYQPSSLLYFYSKILEHAVYNQLSLIQYDLQDILQSGFKAVHCFDMNLWAVTKNHHAVSSTEPSQVLLFLLTSQQPLKQSITKRSSQPSQGGHHGGTLLLISGHAGGPKLPPRLPHSTQTLFSIMNPLSHKQCSI